MNPISNKIQSMSEWQLRNLRDTLSNLDAYSYAYELEIINERLDVLRIERERLDAERWEQHRLQQIERQKAEEEAKRLWESDPVNKATEAGWKAMKKMVPSLDGVNEFTDLPEVLQYRYGAFARAVLNAPMPEGPIPLSHKQVAGLTPMPEGME